MVTKSTWGSYEFSQFDLTNIHFEARIDWFLNTIALFIGKANPVIQKDSDGWRILDAAGHRVLWTGDELSYFSTRNLVRVVQERWPNSWVKIIQDGKVAKVQVCIGSEADGSLRSLTPQVTERPSWEGVALVHALALSIDAPGPDKFKRPT